MEGLLNVWTPLHHRIISHRLGDETLNFYKRVSWDNKHIIGFYILCKILKIKLWNPTRSDSYGTMKIIIPNYLYKSFAVIYGKDYERLKADRLYLLDSTMELSDDYRLQTILSLIVDDGSCTSWLLVVFEDTDKAVVEKVQTLWESLFPGTSKINYLVTKRGKRVYHLYANRNGIIMLYGKLEQTLETYGPFSGLWWKEETFRKRYLKAISPRAKMLEERRKMKEKWACTVLNLIERQGYATMADVQEVLRVSYDRALLVVHDLRRGKKLKLVGYTHQTKYVLEK